MRVFELISFLSLLSVIVNSYNYNSNYKEITITDGRIRGKQLITYKNNTYYAFQDIPYARPPIGPLRLKEAVPPAKWDGVLNTTANLKVCHQFQSNHLDPRENEDCLILNVYTPLDEDDYDEYLPVVVWIHGGAFVEWSGAIESFGPDYFIDQKLVVVTINYRLGPLGFLSTGDGVVPENLGLKDQQCALKWVNQNIDKFGGDPSKVTISGQSAGAASVGYHVLNKKSKGLFRAAIMESGSPLSCWSLQKNARNVAQLIGGALSDDGNSELSSEEILSLVQYADIEKLKAKTIELQTSRFLQTDIANCHQYTSTLFAPVLEDDDNIENSIVTGLNHEKLKSGDINQVPILIGINSEESILFDLSGLLFQTSLIDSNLSTSITENMNMKNENKEEAGQIIRNLYVNSTFGVSPSGSLNFLSDILFSTPIAEHAFLQSQYTDVYFYQFSYQGTLGKYVYIDIEGATGVAHEEEIGYFWHNSTNGDLSQYPKEDIFIHERVVELWSQFIKYSNPTAVKTDILGDIVWPKVTLSNFSYINIDTDLTIKNNPKKYPNWSEIYLKYGENKLDTY